MLLNGIPIERDCIQSSAAPRPIAPAIGGVPASNRRGGGRKVALASVTSSIICPLTRNGSSASTELWRPQEHADTGSAQMSLLCPRRRRNRCQAHGCPAGHVRALGAVQHDFRRSCLAAVTSRGTSVSAPVTLERWSRSGGNACSAHGRAGRDRCDPQRSSAEAQHHSALYSEPLPGHEGAVLFDNSAAGSRPWLQRRSRRERPMGDGRGWNHQRLSRRRWRWQSRATGRLRSLRRIFRRAGEELIAGGRDGGVRPGRGPAEPIKLDVNALLQAKEDWRAGRWRTIFAKERSARPAC